MTRIFGCRIKATKENKDSGAPICLINTMAVSSEAMLFDVSNGSSSGSAPRLAWMALFDASTVAHTVASVDDTTGRLLALLGRLIKPFTNAG